MKTLVCSGLVLLLAAPASAQVASSPSDVGATAPSAGIIANPGGLNFGTSSTSGAGSAGAAGSASNPGGLDFGRTGGTGGAPSGTGAGISTGATGTLQTDDTYLYPLYGRSFR